MNNNEWQPIETAPKDGTNILSWCKEYGLVICSWTGHEDDNGQFETGWIAFHCFATYKFNPTYWIPIPKPPAQ
jgi:hypothetical protein